MDQVGGQQALQGGGPTRLTWTSRPSTTTSSSPSSPPRASPRPSDPPSTSSPDSEDEVAQAKAQTESNSSSTSSAAPPPPSSSSDPGTPTNPDPPIPTPPAAAAAPKPAGKNMASPYAEKLAKQHKVNINSLVGSGSYRRITPADMEKAAGIQTNKLVALAAVDGAVATNAEAPRPLMAVMFLAIPGASIIPFMMMQVTVSKNMVKSLSVPTFRIGYPMMTDALDGLYERVNVTADHRIVYGAGLAAFLQTFAKIVGSPDTLTL